MLTDTESNKEISNEKMYFR